MDRREFLRKSAGAGAFAATSIWIGDYSNKSFGNWAVSDVEDVERKEIEAKLTYRENPPINVNGIPVEVIGIRHIYKNFRGNLDKIEAQVADSKAVVLEYFDPIARRLAVPGFKNQEFRSNGSLNREADGFFGGVGSICAELGKDVYIANPETYGNQKLDMYMLTGLPATLIAKDFGKQILSLAGYRMRQNGFPSNFGYMLATATWFSWVNVLRSAHIRGESGKYESPSFRFVWNEVDYRDVVAAENVANFASKISKAEEPIRGDKISVYQGSAHEDVITYLENPIQRKLRMATYPHHLALSQSPQRFHFDKSTQTWRKIPI